MFCYVSIMLQKKQSLFGKNVIQAKKKPDYIEQSEIIISKFLTSISHLGYCNIFEKNTTKYPEECIEDS